MKGTKRLHHGTQEKGGKGGWGSVRGGMRAGTQEKKQTRSCVELTEQGRARQSLTVHSGAKKRRLFRPWSILAPCSHTGG